MRRLSLIGGALAIVLVGLMVACDRDPVTRNPLAPSPSVLNVEINGPSSIPPGQSGQFIASIRQSDGTVKSASAENLRWRSSNTSVLQVTASGLVTAGQNPGEATVTAELLPTTVIRSTREVVVVPDGTYRLVGSVREAEAPLPIIGARVELSGTSLVATTDFSGQYRLYGVPAAAEIRVTANGYLPVVQNVQLAAHGTQNFQLALSGPRLSLNGPVTLAIDVVGTCSGNPGLPENLQHRTYEAAVTTTGSLVEVRLIEPRFRVNNSGLGNWFTGRADPASVTFRLDTIFWYYFYYVGYPSVAERLSDNTYLVPFGTAATSRTNGGVSGPMNGAIFNYDSSFPAWNSTILGGCASGGFRVTLSRG